MGSETVTTCHQLKVVMRAFMCKKNYKKSAEYFATFQKSVIFVYKKKQK